MLKILPPPCNLLYVFDEHAQLRQLRSKFDRLSTYLCRRFSSRYTNSIHTRPLTIWTFCDRSRQVDTDSSIVASSKLFKYIATQVLNKGSQAVLSKKIVISLQSEAKENGKIERVFKSILLLFEENLNIDVIANPGLNRELKTLAFLLSLCISEANSQISKEYIPCHECYGLDYDIPIFICFNVL